MELLFVSRIFSEAASQNFIKGVWSEGQSGKEEEGRVERKRMIFKPRLVSSSVI